MYFNSFDRLNGRGLKYFLIIMVVTIALAIAAFYVGRASMETDVICEYPGYTVEDSNE